MTPDERKTLKRLVDEARRATHNIRERRREIRLCSGCGCDFNSYVTGCRQCIARHWSRKRRGHDAVRMCRGCSGHLDELNIGCSTCSERFKGRGFGRNGDYRVAA